MPKIAYIEKKFQRSSMEVIDWANEIVEEYRAQGFVLTLRQLYYQYVSRGLMPNTDPAYERLGRIINKARLAGYIDWEAIEDRTRTRRTNPHWVEPSDILHGCARQFAVDKWEGQPKRPEVFIEKAALAGVISGICQEMDVGYLACIGYVSQSEMWRQAQRMKEYAEADIEPIVLHLGDHDPSGIDMTRDIQERLGLLSGGWIHRSDIRRIALNMDQIEEYNPPPNPAKVSDSRFESYLREYGAESWELDALEPQVIVDLIRQNVLNLRDDGLWWKRVALEEEGRQHLREIAESER